jgi:hypothetical protein
MRPWRTPAPDRQEERARSARLGHFIGARGGAREQRPSRGRSRRARALTADVEAAHEFPAALSPLAQPDPRWVTLPPPAQHKHTACRQPYPPRPWMMRHGDFDPIARRSLRAQRGPSASPLRGERLVQVVGAITARHALTAGADVNADQEFPAARSPWLNQTHIGSRSHRLGQHKPKARMA